MSKRFALLLVLVAAIATAASVTPVGNATQARALDNNQAFPDSIGENPTGLDIQSLNLSNDNKGNITLVVNVPNRPTLTPDMLFLIFVDADANPATGDPDSLGADYAIQLEGPLSGSAQIGLFRWDGTTYAGAGVPQTSLTFGYLNGAATIKVNASELGSTKKINFAVIGFSELALDANGDPDFTNAHVDTAPDQGHGFFSYDVKTLPPSLVVKSFGTKPAKPHAGKAFSVFVVYARSDGSASTGVDSAVCKGSVAGHALKGTGAVTNGRATCTFAVPKTAKGKTIHIVLTVVGAEGTKTSHTFNAKVT